MDIHLSFPFIIVFPISAISSHFEAAHVPNPEISNTKLPVVSYTPSSFLKKKKKTLSRESSVGSRIGLH